MPPPSRTVQVRYRNLPHWTTDEGTYFTTFRLADSLPADVARRILHRKRYHRLADRFLDRCFGSCVLREPSIASIVEGALRYFDGERYRLHAFAVMPNHVHTVFRTAKGIDCADILKSWKGFTGREINRLLGRRGTLWQEEPYDTLLHDQNDLTRVVEYTVRNPARAGLRDWPFVGVLDTKFRFS